MDDDNNSVLSSSSSSITSITAKAVVNRPRCNTVVFMRRSSSPSLLAATNPHHLHNHQLKSHRTSVSTLSNDLFNEEKMSIKYQQAPHQLTSHHSSYADEYDNEFSSICNLAKLKTKQDEAAFINLLNECQNWIEVCS